MRGTVVDRGRGAAEPGRVLATLAGMPDPGPTVLHVNDCASTTERLLAEAATRGLPWTYQPLLDRRYPFTRGSRPLTAALALPWLAELGFRARRSDLLHVHYGNVVRHTRWTGRPYLLHLHGTDIRTQQYEPRWQDVIRSAVRDARAVYYSTPDLAEHVLPLRADARYMPVPLRLEGLPRWEPAERPRVVFASRWEEVKGLEVQLEVARGLRAATGPDVELVGLDWGPGAGAAREAGVRLLPRMPHPEYLRLLASAHVAVGQAAGILATSELEAMAMAVPVVARLEPRWHPDGVPAVLPALPAGGSSAPATSAQLVDAAVAALADPRGTSEALDAPAWVRREHSAAGAVDELTARYAELAG